MSLTIEQVKELFYTAQVEAIKKDTPQFYAKHPEYLESRSSYRPRTVEGIVAEEIDNLGGEPDWDEIGDGVYGGHTVKIVDSFGGEGKGDEYWIVFDVDGQLFCKNGYYTSYDGTDWSYGDLEEVEPYQETVTKYRKVSK